MPGGAPAIASSRLSTHPPTIVRVTRLRKLQGEPPVRLSVPGAIQADEDQD